MMWKDTRNLPNKWASEIWVTKTELAQMFKDASETCGYKHFDAEICDYDAVRVNWTKFGSDAVMWSISDLLVGIPKSVATDIVATIVARVLLRTDKEFADETKAYLSTDTFAARAQARMLKNNPDLTTSGLKAKFAAYCKEANRQALSHGLRLPTGAAAMYYDGTTIKVMAVQRMILLPRSMKKASSEAVRAAFDYGMTEIAKGFEDVFDDAPARYVPCDLTTEDRVLLMAAGAFRTEGVL